MFFNKIRGHRDVLSLLGKMIEKNNVEGTFIFSGPVGVGKHTVAKTYSKYLTCVGALDDSCRCDSCRAFPNTPDILFIAPSNISIKIDQIREIEEFLSLSPFKAKRRVVVLDDAETMTYSASNALLKISEEPPPGSVIILVTGSPDKILYTIQSRAEYIEFGSLSEEDYLSVMSDRSHDKNSLKELVPCLNSFSSNSITKYTVQLSSLMVSLEFLKDLSKNGDDDLISSVSDTDFCGDLKEFAEALIICLSDIYRFKKLGTNGILLKDRWEKIAGIEKEWTEEGCLTSVEKIRQALDSVDNRLNLKLKSRLIVSLLLIKHIIKKENKQ